MHPDLRHRADRIRDAARVALRAIDAARASARPGATTADIDHAVRAVLVRHDAEPLIAVERPVEGRPPACSVCVNDEALEYAPGGRVLRAADLVTIDVPVRLHGWAADVARSWVVPGGPPGPAAPGEPGEQEPPEAAARRELIESTEAVIRTAIGAIRPRTPWSAAASAASARARELGVSLIRGFAGHAVGRSMHEAPAAPIPGPRKWGIPGALMSEDFTAIPGLVLTIEPVVTRGPAGVIDLGPGLGVRTRSGRDACTIERLVLVTEDGAELLDVPA